MAPAQVPSSAILLTVVALIILVNVTALLIFSRTFGPWLRAYFSGTPVSALYILGMRLRRTDVNVVLKALIMAKQAGMTLSCREMESAYLQGVDLERLTLAMIHAKRQGQPVAFNELVEADLEDRLAEALGRQVGSVRGRATARQIASTAAVAGGAAVRTCQKCSKQVTDDSRICRNCGAIL